MSNVDRLTENLLTRKTEYPGQVRGFPQYFYII